MPIAPFKINALNKSVLIIGDTHIPYSHKDYLKFLKDIKTKMKPDIIIHVGDELDYHAISFHKSDSSLLNADEELDRSIDELHSGLHKLFPKMYLLESNHGSLITRRLKVEGIPVRTLKPLKELYETPKWSWHHDIILKTKLGDVYGCHGKTKAYGKMAKEMGISCFQGHHHGSCEITWHQTVTSTRFNMLVGCLVDDTSMAMAYGRNNLPISILSSAFIHKDGTPQLIKMNLNSRNRYNGTIS